MLLRHYRSNMQLVLGRLYLVPLSRDSDDWGVYASHAGPNVFGTSLMVRGSLTELVDFFEKKGLEMPKALA